MTFPGTMGSGLYDGVEGGGSRKKLGGPRRIEKIRKGMDEGCCTRAMRTPVKCMSQIKEQQPSRESERDKVLEREKLLH